MTAAAVKGREPRMHAYGYTQIYTKYPVAQICTISLLLLTLFSNSHFSLLCVHTHTHSRETNSHLPFHLLLFNDAEWHSQEQSPAYPLHSAAPQELSPLKLCVDTVGFL